MAANGPDCPVPDWGVNGSPEGGPDAREGSEAGTFSAIPPDHRGAPTMGALGLANGPTTRSTSREARDSAAGGPDVAGTAIWAGRPALTWGVENSNFRWVV